MRCLITGASGFIGSALAAHLRAIGQDVVAWPRSHDFDLTNTSNFSGWVDALKLVDTVIHLAGLAHQPQGGDDERYFRINRDGTLRLAAAARAAGVKRFIFLSSAKVFGEGGARPYRASTAPRPEGAYAESKWQAEQQLRADFGSAMELVILRPPLVYARHAKANFAALMRLARLPVPLPFAGVDNRRSLIGLDNLIDLIARCVTSPAAAGQTLLCADARSYSLADLIAAMRRARGRPPHLFRLPAPIFGLLKIGLGAAASARLFGDFEIDSSETHRLLGWQPPFSMDEILRTTPPRGAAQR